MHAAEKAAADDLLGRRPQIVAEDHHVVAVPADAAAQVQQDFIEEQQHRRNLVGDRLGGVEMARVEAQQLPLGHRVAQIELVRADHVALRADPEQLALDGVAVVGRVDRRGEQFVQGAAENLPRPKAVDGHVLHAVGNPDVRDAGRAQAAAEGLADPAAGDAVLDPDSGGCPDRGGPA